MEKRSFEKKRWELSVDDQTVIDSIEDLCEKEPLDILLIMGQALNTILFILLLKFS